MRLSERIQHVREQAELTRTELAEHVGVSATTIARWEQGLTTPDIIQLRRVARACGWTVRVVWEQT